jgi:Spy/CpxP family protein refolding chaperone
MATRRDLLKAAAAVGAVAAMPLAAFAATEPATKTSVHSDHNNGDQPMNTVKTKDGI